MSYILDALKKSQRERVLGSIPHLDTPAPDTQSRRGLRFTAIGATVLALIGAGVLAGTFLGRQAREAPLQEESAAAPSRIGAADAEGSGSTATGPPVPVAAPGPGPVQHEPAADDAPPPAPLPAAGPAPLLSDTPLDFQRRVPGMTLNVVSYSDVPERRFVMIDLVMYREGQTLPNGATVVAIEADEVTFGYAGQRFRLRP